MATYERHLINRRGRELCLGLDHDVAGSEEGGARLKTEPRRRQARTTSRKIKTSRARHQHMSAQIARQTNTRQTDTMGRVNKSLKELAQLLGLQTVGVDEASLLETTVAFFKAVSDTEAANSPDTHRGGRYADGKDPVGPSSHESQHSPDPSPTDAILAGFQDCMEETIRYLVDVQGFSPDDKVVVGLTAHLLQIRAKLDINNDTTAAVPWSSMRSSSDGGGPTECEATTSTQTSPQETNTLSLALAADSRRCPATVQSQSGGTLATEITAKDRLPRGLPPAHLMTPLTVDTNQYYALPSPLNRTALACALKPSEPLLTVAPTRSTRATPTYTSMTSAAVAAVSGPPLTASAPLDFPRRTAAPQQPYPSVLSANGHLLPCIPATASGQRPYGYNLNYVTPYVVAWVRPVQE